MDDQKAEQDAPEPQDEQAPEVTPEEQPAAEVPEPEAESATEAAETAEEGAVARLGVQERPPPWARATEGTGGREAVRSCSAWARR